MYLRIDDGNAHLLALRVNHDLRALMSRALVCGVMWMRVDLVPFQSLAPGQLQANGLGLADARHYREPYVATHFVPVFVFALWQHDG